MSRGDAKFFAEIGFDAYFSKPVIESDIIDSLSLVIKGGAALENANPLVTKHYLSTLRANEAPQKMNGESRILLVEDNAINQAVAQGILESVGFYCNDIAGNGLEAINALKSAEEDSPFDLVLMDCQMPELDGYEATREIRNGRCGDFYRGIPILAMTANAMKGDEQKCLDAGMSDYISKPIDADKLQNKLQKWL